MPLALTAKTRYVGRFAPSPSGPLHFGSLVTALASYLDAKAHKGTWLVRMEDIDPPREIPAAKAWILQTLQSHGLLWDGDVLYQSDRSAHYREQLQKLKKNGLTYDCICTRKRLAALNHLYDGHCRNSTTAPGKAAAIRINTEKASASLAITSTISIKDCLHGEVHEDFSQTGDFIIHRKDGLFAYQLATSCDDLAQNISHIVRGADLLDSSCKQAMLIQLLGGSPPSYCHIPVVVDEQGRKLSKQNHAPALDNDKALNNLRRACLALDIHLPRTQSIEELLNLATEQWNPTRLVNKTNIIESQLAKSL